MIQPCLVEPISKMVRFVFPEEASIVADAVTLIAILVPTVIAAMLLHLRQNVRKEANMKIPGRPGGQYPIVGDTLLLLNPKTMGSYQVSSRYKWGSPVWRTSVLFQKCVFVSGASHLKQLSKEERSKKNTVASFPPHHRALFGEHSVLVTSGVEHGKLRGAISPALQPHFYHKEIDMAAVGFVEGCKRHSGKGFFPLVPELKQFTLRVMLRVAFGEKRWQGMMIDSSSGCSNESSLLSTLVRDFSIWSKGILGPPTTFIPYTPAHKAMAARNRIRDVLLRIIREEREILEKEENETANVSSDIKSSSMIRMLLRTSLPILDSNESKEKSRSSSKLSDDAIVDNILTLAFAGTDTTASVLTSAFLVLSQNVNVRQRLHSSINSSSIDNASSPNCDDVLSAFLSEVQRMYPAAPFTMRKIEQTSNRCPVGSSNYRNVEGIDMGDGFGCIPAGFLVTYAIAGTLKDDAETYPDPGTFNLDRWLKQSNNPQATTPPVWAFGGGFRMCPGRFLSNAEATALLRRVLCNENGLVWELKENQDLEYSYTPGYFPNDGLLIKIV